MLLCYIAYLNETEGGIECFSPDGNFVTRAPGVPEAVAAMRVKLAKWIKSVVAAGGEIPRSTCDISDKNIKGSIAIIDVEYIPREGDAEFKYVRKNVTLPMWVNREGEKRGMSFSKELQNALLTELDIDDDN